MRSPIYYPSANNVERHALLSPMCRYILIPLVDFANHDDNVAFAVGAGDGVFTGSDEVRFGGGRLLKCVFAAPSSSHVAVTCTRSHDSND